MYRYLISCTHIVPPPFVATTLVCSFFLYRNIKFLHKRQSIVKVIFAKKWSFPWNSNEHATIWVIALDFFKVQAWVVNILSKYYSIFFLYKNLCIFENIRIKLFSQRRGYSHFCFFNTLRSWQNLQANWERNFQIRHVLYRCLNLLEYTIKTFQNTWTARAWNKVLNIRVDRWC